ncbi:MAG: hypothetical protein IJJ41_07105, partial [Clostridia bacterium]|nr:hypothetical protein [Clostridia bacterium]
YSLSRATHSVANAKVPGTNSKSLIWLVGRVFSRAAQGAANAKVPGTNSKSLIWLVGRALIHYSLFITNPYL